MVGNNREEYIEMLSDFIEHLETMVFMFKNPDMFNENEKYDEIEHVRKTCKLISEDMRGTGTLMKDMEL
ncbi:MAG: hypothetical protein NC548_55975 [Lachnospiraceae bacterium]|nr:hypothetical protein [Lachnospiraceae bacterium]